MDQFLHFICIWKLYFVSHYIFSASPTYCLLGIVKKRKSGFLVYTWIFGIEIYSADNGQKKVVFFGAGSRAGGGAGGCAAVQ